MWQPNPKMTFKLLHGNAFCIHAFFEFLMGANPWNASNPDLKPETIKTWELAFDYQATNKLHLTTNLYTYEWRDGIIIVPIVREGTSANVVSNFGVQDGHGLELEARWKVNKKSSLLMNYAFTKATNKLTDHDAGTYPKHSGYLRVDHLLYPNWYLNGQVNWVGEVGRVANDPRSSLRGYRTVDLTLRRKDESHWNAAISVRNLLDSDARVPSEGPNSSDFIDTPYDIPLAGRNYWLEIRYRF